jgi:dolichyl-phosphate beta-glucosyltransferase
MPSFAIIIPCYNEAGRIRTPEFIDASRANPEMELYFVNDGSIDNTGQKLLEIQQGTRSTKIISLQKNTGKGEAIRKGLLAALQDRHQLVGYLDADLSTEMEEFLRLKNLLVSKELDIVLGSRIKKMDTVIERSFFRHITGRMIATIIDQKFKLGVYDTQCGAKIFRSSVIENAVRNRFYTKWFFDVEILLRIKKKAVNYTAAEIPLNKWQNVANSKLSMLSFPAVAKDLFVLLNNY